MKLKVAVLLPTFNGARFVEEQIRSLTENSTPFTLHWLDDHSTDNTRETVRTAALATGIDLKEWHQHQHQGWPATFFQLIECVEADIYMFCDQDDIWQPGKIDATVTSLLLDVARPVLCFSFASLFKDSDPGTLHRLFADSRSCVEGWMRESIVFTTFIAQGNTIGFTRSLRDLFFGHKEIARMYASDHDWWMYLIAVAAGEVRLLDKAPTTLHRRHGNNLSEAYIVQKGRDWIARRWSLEQEMRRMRARNAQGFLLASASLPPSQKLERLIALARLMATIGRRQSSAAVIRLARCRAIWPTFGGALWRAALYLGSDAR